MRPTPRSFSHIGLSVPDLDKAIKFYGDVLDRIGFELFEFDGNEAPEENMKFRRHGTFHFAIQDPNLEDLLAKIVAAGGKQRMPIREYFPNEKPYRMVYVEDPFGIVFELYSHSYELTYSNGAYS